MARPSAIPGPPLETLSPNRAVGSSPPWYRKPAADSDPDDTQNDTEFDFLAGASTPLHVNQTKQAMFISPMKRLDQLRLSPGKTARDAAARQNLQLNFLAHQEDDEDEDDDDDYGAGDKTIHSESSSSDAEQPLEPLAHPAPTFIPQRKRKHTDSPLDMEITPMAGNHTIPHGSSGKDMWVVGMDTGELALRLSFSASDSTPCPTQPRKRLRFKASASSEETTPSQPSRTRKPLLNFSSSRKLSANGVTLIHKLNDAHDDDPDDMVLSSHPGGDSATPGSSAPQLNVQSTPISQSTPANSRAPSPFSAEGNGESNESVNGFTFVRSATKIQHQTPQTRPTSSYGASQRLINAYNTNDYTQTGKYEIMGELRVSAAGLADDDADDMHVGDKRINDPYLMPSPSSNSASFNNDYFELRQKYLVSTDKLPLLQHFERDLTREEMLQYINDQKSVSSFYESIFTSDQDMGDGLLSVLKKERLRWHPDKWVGKHNESVFDKEIINNLSQVINSLIEEL